MLDELDFFHVSITDSKLFVDRDKYINGIDNFWNQAKRAILKRNGTAEQQFGLFLKACK